MTRPWILALLVAAGACSYPSAPSPPTDPPVAKVVVAAASPAIVVGQTTQFTATAYDASGGVIVGRTVTWNSSDQAVATVDQGGLVKGLASGSSKISAVISGATGALDVSVTAH